MKKILSVFLVLAMMLSLVVVTTVAPSAEPVTTGTKLTGANLMSLTAGEYYMTEDIDFQGFDLSAMSAMTLPDGTVIHGNGYSIKGLNSPKFAPFTVNGTVTINNLQIGGTDGAIVYDGLFTFGENATLNLNNVDVNIKSTNVATGVINAEQGAITAIVPAGCTLNCTDCTVSGKVGSHLAWNAGNSGNGHNAIGGFVGYTKGAIVFDNCELLATLDNGDQACGGFVGTMSTGSVVTIKNSVSQSAAAITGGKRVGGFVGNLLADNSIVLTIENCINRSTVTTTNDFTGGFVGEMKGIISISKSVNLGDVTATNSSQDGAAAVGGFVGKADTAANKDGCVISSCVNYGAITGNKNTAALCGQMAWATGFKALHCYNYGTINARYNDAGMVTGANTANGSSSYLAEYCVNFGTLTSTANVSMLGEWSHDNAVDGQMVAKYCLNVGDITGGSNSAAMIAFDCKGAKLEACSTIGTFTASSWYTGGLVCGRNEKVDDHSHAHELVNCYNYGKMIITGNSHNGVIVANEVATLSDTSTGNKYLYDPTVDEDATFNTIGGTKVATVDEAVADLNTLYNTTLGLTFKNVDGEIEVVAQPKFVGTQTSATGAKVRLLGTIDGDLADYAKVGFKVSSKVGETVKTYDPSKAAFAYYFIKANDTVVTAANYGGSYFYTLTFTGVPQTGTVEFTVQAYAEYTNGLTYTGAAYTVVCVDGAVTSVTAAD